MSKDIPLPETASSHLVSAAESSLDFWDNAYDDEDWNGNLARQNDCAWDPPSAPEHDRERRKK